MNELLENKRIKIVSKINHSLFVKADANRLRQVLWNLILNSLQNMEQGTITVSAKEELGKAYIFVADNGSGLPENKFEEIFNPYTTLSQQGIGMGLYVSRKLIELMNGKIYVDWSQIGKGSRFAIVLPISNKKSVISSDDKKSLKL